MLPGNHVRKMFPFGLQDVPSLCFNILGNRKAKLILEMNNK